MALGADRRRQRATVGGGPGDDGGPGHGAVRPVRGAAVFFSGMIAAPLVMPEVITGLFAAPPVRGDGAGDRLARWPRSDHHRHRPHHLLDGLCRGDRGQSRLAGPRRIRRGGGAGPRRPASQGLLRDHPADHRPGADRRLAACIHPVARRSGDRQLRSPARAVRPCRWWYSPRSAWASARTSTRWPRSSC